MVGFESMLQMQYENDDIVMKGADLNFTKEESINLDMMNISLLPLPIQQKVVKYLDEVSQNLEKIKSLQKEKMDNLKALKASILDKAFKGEL